MLIKDLMPPKIKDYLFGSTTTDDSFIMTGGGTQNNLFTQYSNPVYLDWFLQIPEVNTVLGRKATMYSKMEIEVISKKTQKPLDKNNYLSKLIATPNWNQSITEFLIQQSLYYNIFGNSYIHALKPVGFSGKSTKQLTNIHPLSIKLIDAGVKTPGFLLSAPPKELYYEYRDNSKNVPLSYRIEYEDIILQNNQNVVNEKLIGVSPLQALQVNILNIKAAYESRGIILNNRGATGILSNNSKDGIGSTMSLKTNDKENLQKELRKYGSLKNQYSTIITNMNLTWQKMGGNMKEMMLFEETEADFMRICDKFGIDYQLFATEKGTTFNNVQFAEKQTYTNTIIPEAMEFINLLNTYFGTEKESYEIVANFQHLPIFNVDKKELAVSLKLFVEAMDKLYATNIITIEEYKRQLQMFEIEA